MKVPPIAPFQTKGVLFVEKLNGRAIIGDEMGLGKTYQAIGWLALNPQARPITIVCPASIKLKWKRELWEFAGLKSTVLYAFKPFGVQLKVWKKKKDEGKPIKTWWWFRTIGLRREAISENWHRIEVLDKKVRQHEEIRDITIVNYDILQDWEKELAVKVKGGTLIIDEAQKIKSQEAKRTKICDKISKVCNHVIALSGTLVTNRPVEAFPALHIVAPNDFNSFTEFAFRYCNPQRGFRGRGWDFSGASNLPELHARLSKYMIRRMRVDVMPDLPPKIRSIIPVELTNQAEYETARDAFVQWLTEKKGILAAKRAKGAVALVRLGALKRLAAEGKLKSIKEWADDFLEDGTRKLVLFAWHTAIIDRLMLAFPGALMIDGRVPPNRRQEVVDGFQNDPSKRLFLGQIDAAGTGIGLTASHTVGFVELGWTPGEHDQAEDRCLRIGQKSDRMDAYYFLGDGTVDDDHWALIGEKRKVVGGVLDGRDTSADIPQKIIEGLISRYGK